MSFQKDSYVKLTDTRGNFRFGYIGQVKEHGFVLVIDLNEEGLSKINWDNELVINEGNEILVRDFNVLLTDTEKKLVPYLASRWDTGSIASILKIKPSTVRVHIRDMKIKLQVDTREQLFTYAQGIVKKLK
jgi:DNA-binding CsgD family transcriptional regulator